MTEPKYGALSRDFGEGGYTFLKRVLRENLRTGRPVVVNTGRLYLSYSYSEGHERFMEGVTVLEDGGRKETMDAFRSVAEPYDVKRGIAEIAAENRATGPLPGRKP